MGGERMSRPVERLWKVTNATGRACYGGRFQYNLPRWSRTRGWVPGAWTPNVPVDPCNSGYHVCRDGDVRSWIGGLTNKIWACEGRGAMQVADDKVVYESIRLTMPTPWDECSARLWAVECASAALPFYEARHPNDPRVANALIVAHQYALGLATDTERAAAWASARASWASAGAAAWAAEAAAWASARACWASAGAAAWAAEAPAWAAQNRRLLWWLGVDDA